MEVRQKKFSNTEGALVNDFFTSAYSDYISARILFLHNRLLDACFFANTAIEKYLKGFVSMYGDSVPRHHDLTASRLLNPLKNKHKAFYSHLNIDFLSFLSSAYKMRYFDSLEVDFNTVILKRKTLAELDKIVTFIEENVTVSKTNRPNNKKKYLHDKEGKNSYLWTGNFYLHGMDQRKFVDKDNLVYEARKTVKFGMMEVQYTTVEPVYDRPFVIDALIEIDNGGLRLSYKPVNPSKEGVVNIDGNTTDMEILPLTPCAC